MTAPSVAKLLRRLWLDSFEGLATAEYKLKKPLDVPRFYGYNNACSGGNSRPSHLSGVGGGNFLIKRLFWGEQPTSSLSAVISFRAKSPSAKLKAEMVARFVLEPEASMQRLISLIPKTLFPRERIPSFIIRPPGLRFRPMVVYFGLPAKHRSAHSSSTNAVSISSARTT
jgi:hypothetical protein